MGVDGTGSSDMKAGMVNLTFQLYRLIKWDM